MTNKEIGSAFRELAQLMELHADNPFKIRSYQNAYMTLRKLDQPVAELDEAALANIKGIGKAISGKIIELIENGQMEALEKFRKITPPGVRDMLGIAGFGPKKVRQVWQELGVESVGELLYAVNENRLLELKGFGLKTQEDLKAKLAYFKLSQGQFLYATVEARAIAIRTQLQQALPQAQVAWTGALRRACPTLDKLALLVAGATSAAITAALNLPAEVTDEGIIKATTEEEFPVWIYTCTPAEWGSRQFRYTAAPPFLAAFMERFPGVDFKNLATEAAVFSQARLPVLPPELREEEWGLQLAVDNKIPTLIDASDVRGVIHSHTTYSDGIHSLADMANYAREQGYGYIGITDHSKAAFYANGLSPERVLDQMQAIDQLNAQQTDFRIFKGIESDILADGSLDYEEDLLRQFDFIIASIHSNLRMDEEKATQRLITAIENPYTSILGHPTGRLLLSRPGYPIDHRKVIDACAANQVAIELNASPYRLDLDWTWLPYAVEKGVWISINPDAHSKAGIHAIYFGTFAARKGGLTVENCLNARSASAFYELVHKW
ncbi:MAG: DNA polymerase/3'-5' exonuclease PolX [Bacteroidetes bacterium]|nr:MAG: DNA polymerase/3'-5' exonuclease PolX [Bacteroidota bacterium]